jgi:NAD(P)-dependent dehydrogenase (short-subunit alcohol dehydrogenase family)
VSEFVETRAEQEGLTTEDVEDLFFREERPTSLLQRFEDPDEIAVLIAYLSSELASATNGAAVRVDGGVVRSAF